MHIVYVTREYVPSKRGGGIAAYVKEMANGMAENGHQVTVVCASDDTRKEADETIDGVRIIHLKGGDFVIRQVEGNSFLKKFRMYYRFYSYRRRLVECLKHLKNIDIIEVAEFGAENLYFNELRIPVVVRLHGPMLVVNEFTTGGKRLSLSRLKLLWLGRKEETEIKKAKYITSCSNALKEIVHKRLGIENEKIEVVFNPIDTTQWKGLEHSDFTQNKVTKILLPGTYMPLKGGEDLIKACILLKEKYGKETELYLVGKESIFGDYLKTEYASKNNWIHITGVKPRDELMKMYREMDIVCIPSWWENMPMTCIEAMLLGCIVVANRTGGIPEIITDGVDGVLANPHDVESLADKINKAIEMSLSDKKIMSEKAKERAIKSFSLDAILTSMTDYYNKVITDYKKQ